MQELSFDHPSHLYQCGNHVTVCDQLFIYSSENICIICE